MATQNPFDDLEFGSELSGPEGNPFDNPEFGKEPGFASHAKDLGLSLAKGVIAVPEAAVGLADIATGGRAGKFLENEGGAFGFRPEQAKAFLSDQHADGYKEQQRQFQDADGVMAKAGVALSNPSLIANTVVESLPAMGAGGVAARGLMGLGARGVAASAGGVGPVMPGALARMAGADAAPLIAGAVGEGAMMAGGAAEQIRQQTEDGLLTPGQTGAAAATGVIGGAFGYGGAKISSKLGIGDVDTMLAQGATRAAGQASSKSIPRQVVEGAMSEGLLEELPQSVSEQLLQNFALGKPWDDGVDAAIVMGTLAGMGMGGAAAGVSGWSGRGEQQRITQEEMALKQAEIERHVATLAEHQQNAERARLNARLQAQARMGGLADEEMGAPDMAPGNPSDYRATPAWAKPPEDAAPDYASADDEIFQSTGTPQRVDPVREAVRQAADAGGALSAAAGVAMDSGAAPTFMPPEVAEQPQEPQPEPVVLQNRDRTSAASIAQMQEIAAAPDYMRAGPSREMATGAPVVFGDLPGSAVVGRQEIVVDGRGGRVQAQYAVVDAADVIASNNADGTTVSEYANGLPGKLRAVAGNGRTAGLQAAYQQGTANNYAQELLNDAGALGIDPQAVAAMQRPVLVRVMNQADVTPDMGDRTNITSTQKLSPVEQAANDSRRFSVESLSFDEQGNPTAQSINGFVSSMPVAERGDMLNPDGTPTRQAVDRLMAATFKQAYDSDELVQLHAQATDHDARSVLAAAADASGVMAALRGTGDFDVRGAVTDAVKMAVNAARQGLKLSDVLQNADFDMNPEAYPVATFLAQNIRSPKAMAEGLRRWGQLALQNARTAEENQYQGGLLGPAPTLSREEIFARIGDAYNPTEQAVAARAQPQAPVAEQASIEPTQPSTPPAAMPVPGNFSGTPSATIGTRTDAVAGPGFGPRDLKSAIAQIRANKQQEAANAKATVPEAAPATTAPAAGTGDVQAAGVAHSKLLASLDQTGATRETVLDVKLKDAQDRLTQITGAARITPADRALWISEINQEIADLNAVRDQARRLDENDRRENDTRSMLRAARQELDAAVRASAITPEAAQAIASNAMSTGNAVGASEAIFAAVDSSTTGASSEPTPNQAIQAGPQPAQTQQADAPGAVARHPTWRQNAIQAGRVARALGLEPKGKRLAQIVAEIDARDSEQNQAVAPANPAQAATENIALDVLERKTDEVMANVVAPGSVNLTRGQVRALIQEKGVAAADKTIADYQEHIAKQTESIRKYSDRKEAASQSQQAQAATEDVADDGDGSQGEVYSTRKEAIDAGERSGANYSVVPLDDRGPKGKHRLVVDSKEKQPQGQAQQAKAAAEPVAQPITRADVVAAQQKAAEIIGARIDEMPAGDVNKIAKKFLPTMGMKPTMSKANNKAVMTDAKINLMAAADEVGATLPAEVKRALQADMEGGVVKGEQQEQAAQGTSAPASKPLELPSITPAIDAHIATMDAVRAGKATPEQFKASFEATVANADAIKVELNGKTKAELLAGGGPYLQARHANSTKPDIVDAVYRSMLGEYTLGQGLSYGMGRDSYQNAVRRLVDATDADKLAQFVKEREAALEEVKTRREATAKALENPQTLDDFRTLMRAKATAGMGQREAFLSLTPEQRIRYDDLAAESTRAAREASKQAQKTQVQAAGQTTGGEIIETKHARDGYDLFVVQLENRLSTDDYQTIAASAKKLGGWYSKFRGNGAVPGFQFKDKANAEAFLKLAGGDTGAAQEQAGKLRDAFEDDRSQTITQRLSAMADKLESAATEEENRDRKANTGRRARFARAALDAAAADKALAKTMRNLAQAIGSGKAKFLDMVRTKTQVDFLANAVKTAKDAELRAKYPSYADQEKRKGEPATAETADHADFPSYSAFRSDLAMLARQLLEVDGTKKLGQRLMSVADDVTDAYMEFAKANLSSVSQFGTKAGDLAEFSSRETAERAIRRSGLTGRAMVLPIKRGENRIILSPSEAISKGIWTGDGDKRITLTRDFGNELVQAIGRRGNRQNQLAVPWQFQNAHDRLKMLERMGIQTSSEYRAALREFIGLKEEAVQNRAREMELEMVGRKADGLDFFPTPATVADQMVEAADLTPDMAVLEPSAGMGHLADRIRAAGVEPDVIEASPERLDLLEEKGYHAVPGASNFLALAPRKSFTWGDIYRAPDGKEGIMRGLGGMGSQRVRLEDNEGNRLGFYDRDELTGIAHRGSWSGYDRIIMNPPFSKRQDAEHVQHAYTLLRPGGRIVAIMGEGVFFGQDKKAQDFRDWLESVGGTSEKLPDGSFMDTSLPVNTGVSARMVVIDKPVGDMQLAPRAEEDKTANYAATNPTRPGTAQDKAVMQALADGKSARDVLRLIASGSKDPFRRQVARLLLKSGITPTIEFGHIGKTKDGTPIYGQYRGKTDTIAIAGSAEYAAERIFMHEAMHAATMRALAKPGLPSLQLRKLLAHVQKQKGAAGFYGTKNVDEFVAEVFTNPDFQKALRGMSAPAGNSLKSAWDSFVRILRSILGLSNDSLNALSQALELGVEAVRQDMVLRKQGAQAGRNANAGRDAERAVGDATPAEAQRVQSAIEGGSLLDAARFLTRSNDKARAAVAQKVLEKLERLEQAGVALQLHIVHRGDMAPAAMANARGYTETGFDSKGRDVAVWLNGADVAGKVGTEEEVLLHELVHATTTGMVFYGRNRPDSLAGKHVRDLMAVTDAIASHITQRFADAAAGKLQLTEFEQDMRAGANNAFRSDDEVLAWALTNAEAQQYLESIPYKSGTLWSSFVQSVRSLLGLSPSSDTALSEVLRVADRLLTDDAPDAGRAAFWHKRGLRMVQQQGRGSQVFINQANARSDAIDQTETDIRNFGMDDTAAASTWESPVQSGFDDVIYKLQDKNIDLKRVVQAITKSAGKVADDINAYLKEELFHKRAAKRVADFGAHKLAPLMNQMRLAGLSMEDVEEYLHARHAKEANAVLAERNPSQAMINTGRAKAAQEVTALAAKLDAATDKTQRSILQKALTNATKELNRWNIVAPYKGTEESRLMLSGMSDKAADSYFAKLDPAQRAKLEAVTKKVDAIIAGTRQLYVDYGLENQAVVDGWASLYKNYIPLMREDKDGGMGIGQGFSVKGKEVKGRTGSTRKVVDILANIASQREKLIVRGEKNRVTQALVGLAQANPNPDFWEVRSQAPTERVVDEATNTVVDRPIPNFKGRDNVVVAKTKDSKGNVTEQMVVFNEDNPRAVRMAAALKNLDAGNLEGLLAVSAKITRYFAAINTQYNPVFGVVNLIRDVQGAMINLAATPLAGQQAKIAKDTFSALRGIYSDIRKTRKGGQANSEWAKLWEQMQDDGGTTGYREMFQTSADRANNLKSILNPEGWMDNKWGNVFTANGQLKVPMSVAQKGATEIFGWLSDYNEAMENGVRLAAYKAALDKGMSREQAASIAKNLTVNFNRKGQVGQQAGAVYAFFNAAMQGTARIGQTLFEMDGGDISTLRLSKTGKAVVYGGVTLGAIQALLLAAAGFDDEDPPEFVRERSLIIPTGGKTYITIPMPLGLHVIPGIGRHATEFALSGFDKPAKRAVSVIGMFADAFNPIGNAGLSMQTLAPTALDPLAALTENKDWTGKPIARTSSNKALPGHTQWKDTATGFSKVVAEAINWVSGGNEYVAGALSPTPDQIDYLLAQLGGGVAREISKVQQTISTAASGEELPTYKIPLVGRFVGSASSQASQGNAFYANLDRLNELETEIKGLRKDGRFEEAAQLARENPQSILIAMANKAERDVQKLRREKRELIANDASREQVRTKEEQITAVMTRLNEAAARRVAAAKRLAPA